MKAKPLKLISIMLAVILCLGVLPVATLGAEKANFTIVFEKGKAHCSTDNSEIDLSKYNISASGNDVSGWVYTFNGVNFSTTAPRALYFTDAKTTVALASNSVNTISGGDSTTENTYGIFFNGELSFKGSGTLNVTAGATSGEKTYSYGIYTKAGVLSSEGVTLNVTSGAASGEKMGSYGIRANQIIINSGTVTATGKNSAYYTCGVYVTQATTIYGGSLTANGGINTGKFTVTGGTINAIGGSHDYSYGIITYSDTAITGGTITATGGNSAHSYGFFPYDGRFQITGGTVTLSGNTFASATYGVPDYLSKAPSTKKDNVNVMKVFASANANGDGAAEIANWNGSGNDNVSGYKYLKLIPKVTTINKITITGVIPPAVGATASYDWSIPDNQGYDKNIEFEELKCTWLELDSPYTASGGSGFFNFIVNVPKDKVKTIGTPFTFKSDKYYLLVIGVNIQEDYKLANNFFATINGKNVITTNFDSGKIGVVGCYFGKPATLTGIEIQSAPSNREWQYKSGVSRDGLKVVAKYSNGTEVDVTSEVDIENYTAENKKGDHIATVKYQGMSATFNYTIKLAWWQWIIQILLLGFIWY